MASFFGSGRRNPLVLVATAGLVVYFVVSLIGGIQAKKRVEKRLARHGTSEVNDLDRFLWLVPPFVQGKGDYVNDQFPTPPITIAIFEPLTWMPPGYAQLVWACCKPVFGAVILWVCLRMAEGSGVKLEAAAALLVVLTWVWPFVGDVQEGQTNLLMLVPLVLGLWLVQRETRGAEWLGGILIGLAVCIKVTPLIFVVYFAWRRRGRVVMAAVSGIALFLVIVPSVLFGPLRNTQWLVGWFRVMILPYVLHGEVYYASGESIPSMVTRFLRHVPAFEGQGGHAAPSYYTNFVDLPEGVVQWIIRGLLGSVVLLTGWWMRRRLPTLRSPRYVAELGVVAAVMLWASERTWVPHYVSMILPLMGAAAVASGAVTEGRRRAAYGMLRVGMVLMMMTSDISKILFGPNGRDLALMYNVPLWATVGLVGVIVAGGSDGLVKSVRAAGRGKTAEECQAMAGQNFNEGAADVES